jgi:hypothetical protein
MVTHGWGREGETDEWSGYTTSKLDVSSITTADAHISAASSRLNWRPSRFKWTCPFRRKTKSGFCTCAITFQTPSTCVDIVKLLALNYGRLEAIRHKTRCKVPFRKPLVKGRKVIAPEILQSDTLCAADTGNSRLLSWFLKFRGNIKNHAFSSSVRQMPG